MKREGELGWEGMPRHGVGNRKETPLWALGKGVGGSLMRGTIQGMAFPEERKLKPASTSASSGAR